MTRDVSDGELVMAVVKRYAEHGSCSQQELADDVGMSKAGVRYRLHRLAEAGLVDLSRPSRIRPKLPDPQLQVWQVELVMKILDGDITEISVARPRQF